MNDLQTDALQTWLAELPFWCEVDARRVFVDDLLWQLGVDKAAGCSGEPQQGPRNVADPRYAACRDADPATAAAAVAGLCSAGVAVAGASAFDVLLWSVLDRGVGIGVRSVVSPLAGLSGEPTPAAGAALTEPYPGPRAFQVADAPIFFGRGLETRQLLRLLAQELEARLVIVAGRSGSGKTSLVQAGLLGSLSRDSVPGLEDSARWPVVVLRPAEQAGDPVDLLAGGLAASGATIPGDTSEIAAGLRRGGSALTDSLTEYLARGLADRPAGARWLFVIDGLEELLRPRLSAQGPMWFDLLRQMLSMPRVRVVATLRSEFLDACVEVPVLRDALNRGGLLALPTPSRRQLEWMLRAPLLREGAAVPAGMDVATIDALVAEAVVAPVPMLHLAARARTAYQQAAAGAAPSKSAPHCFDDWCDAALLECGDADAEVLSRVLSCLVHVEETGGAFRQSALLEAWQTDPAARRLIDALSRDERPLLRIDDGPLSTVCLMHDGLLQAWRRLAHWVDRRREGLRLAARLRAEVASWEAAGFPEYQRWPDELLVPARELLADSDLLGLLERELLLADFLTPESERLLTEVLCSRTDDASREDIGLRLARIGDPRPGVLVRDGCPLPHWCLVPGGVVMIDGRNEVQVAPFRLAAYPVTLAQFDAFVRADDGFDDDAWWSGLKRRPLEGWNAERHGNYPATRLSWHDATAFCRWLGAQLDLHVRLPDEWEWQWAAQSAREDFVYPWGGDWLPMRANTDEAGIGRTTAVGMYPAGQSLQGVSDLAGNTWEWCRSRFELSGQRRGRGAAAERGARVIRGGSWRVNRGFARADFRLDAMPEDRVGSTGFRVACSVDGAG